MKCLYLLILLLIPGLINAYSNISPYSYCAGDPINFVDPTGNEIEMTKLIWADKSIGLNISQSIIEDLNMQTGLTLNLDDNNRLRYATNNDGSPIIKTVLDSDGKSSYAGSETTRTLLIESIDNQKVVDVSYSKRSATNDNSIGLNAQQIDKMIEGAVGVDGNTLGYGMTFMHELFHTEVGGSGKDSTENYGTGEVVDNMNKIRNELNSQGFNYGQRMNYKALPSSEGIIIPFNSSAFKSLQNGVPMSRSDYYIKIEIK
ncbi:MAG: hypothetical protein HDR90_09290 [Bacteroides sp.]|nr:hypothetical protein [Bacteroides sp.]